MIKITHVFPTLHNSKFRFRKITLMETVFKTLYEKLHYQHQTRKKINTYTLYFEQYKTNNKNL